MSNLIIYFLLFVLPFIYISFLFSPFETPKVIAGIIGILFLSIVFLLSKKKVQISKKQTIIIGGFFALTIVQLIFYHDISLFFGNVFRFQGIYLFWILLLFSFVVSQTKQIKINYYIPLFAMIILFLVTLYFGKNQNGRYFGPLGEPNALAAIAVFFWPFVYFAKEKIKFVQFGKNLVAFTIVASLVFLSGSRSGLVALGVQVFFVLLTRFTKFSIKIATIITCLLLVLSLSLSFFDSQGLYENRAELWDTAAKAGTYNLLIGNGFGNMTPAMHRASVEIFNHLQGYNIDSAHNIFLDFFVEGGIVGLVLFIALWLLSLSNFIKAKNTLGTVLFLGLTACLSFNPLSVATLVQFWWLIGQGFVNKKT